LHIYIIVCIIIDTFLLHRFEVLVQVTLEEKDHQLGGEEEEEEVLQDLLHTSMLKNDIILVLKCDLRM
jgi:hypothetical protein